ncbi:hypothetical protein X953_01630 [Virgibacillus sp. SK37]|nr:hypothetical protein X953_01630 [Virgibacillus sp. SK37]
MGKEKRLNQQDPAWICVDFTIELKLGTYRFPALISSLFLPLRIPTIKHWIPTF